MSRQFLGVSALEIAHIERAADRKARGAPCVLSRLLRRARRFPSVHHSDLQTTREHYAFSSDEQKRKVVAKLKF